jgi:hypothetical protein
MINREFFVLVLFSDMNNIENINGKINEKMTDDDGNTVDLEEHGEQTPILQFINQQNSKSSQSSFQSTRISQPSLHTVDESVVLAPEQRCADAGSFILCTIFLLFFTCTATLDLCVYLFEVPIFKGSSPFVWIPLVILHCILILFCILALCLRLSNCRMYRRIAKQHYQR